MWKLNYYIAKIMILIVFCNGGAPQKQGKRIKIIKCIDWKDVDELCKGDTPA